MKVIVRLDGYGSVDVFKVTQISQVLQSSINDGKTFLQKNQAITLEEAVRMLTANNYLSLYPTYPESTILDVDMRHEFYLCQVNKSE